jgi:prepilin-type N-terminal cleavage/methylation domain-containing protein
MIPKKVRKFAAAKGESGFSLIEVIIAIAVLSIGILAIIASLTSAMAFTQSAEENLIARQKALEGLESIYTARNSQQIPFSEVANTTNGGIFLAGAQSLLCPGPDGLVGTADDTPCTTSAGATCPNGGAECWVLPGADGILGTADDVTMSLSNFKRTIAITPVKLPNGNTNQNMMAVAITVTYSQAELPSGSYTVNTLISSYH